MTPSPTSTPRPSLRGFSLIEVLAAVLLTSIVISVAVAFQINLGSSMKGSRERLRTERHAVALLDRISRDLAGAYFIVPKEGGDQRKHPWVFVTAHDFADEDAPADALKFMTRNYVPQGLDDHASDLAVVAYFLNPMRDLPAYELLRWRSTHMPSEYDPRFPSVNDPETAVMGEGLASFGVRLIDAQGADATQWSSVVAGARKGLPRAVRLEISMVDPLVLEEAARREDGQDFDDEFDLEQPDEERKIFSKLVVLPLRPLDWSFLEAEVDAAAGGAGDADGDMDGDGVPDSEGDDIDGDGIPNEDDDELDPDGDFEEADDLGDRDPFGFGADDDDEEGFDEDDF
ncbi:MAG: prepilin-type N-terminal cleavage/methylation domain-containing protein [Myxococcota bacterium]|jgi:prepilin-type N-terminal cleavage/methylation domain-containing protein|nr:prepilin-type N-terminal cleavage/methylation domain-containing protein [Myxococcota bacterium]